MRTTIVTVTYGRRWGFLQQTLQAAFDGGAADAVVVDNGSTEAIAQNISRAFPAMVLTARLEENRGSAGAYVEGIGTALSGGAEFLLLLDDDNCVEPDAIQLLKEAFRSLSGRVSPDKLCMLGLRPDQHPDILAGVPHDPFGDSHDTFLDFHLRDIPRKILKRIPGARRSTDREGHEALKEPFRRRIAPFGGMFFHRSLIERFGYPDPRFVVYVDDTEFSYRISSRGGEIWLVPAARINDIERSWYAPRPRANSFEQWLNRGSDTQIYYTARNKAYFESHYLRRSWMRGLNRTVYMTALWSIAFLMKKTHRFRLVVRAVRDGEAGALGINHEFPLAR